MQMHCSKVGHPGKAGGNRPESTAHEVTVENEGYNGDKDRSGSMAQRAHFQSRVTARAQTTLPSAVRKFLGIEGGETLFYTLDSEQDLVLLTRTPLKQAPEDGRVIETALGQFVVSLLDFERVQAHQKVNDCSLSDAFVAVSPRAMKLVPPSGA